VERASDEHHGDQQGSLHGREIIALTSRGAFRLTRRRFSSTQWRATECETGSERGRNGVREAMRGDSTFQALGSSNHIHESRLAACREERLIE
jgi:hypothetical protein